MARPRRDGEGRTAAPTGLGRLTRRNGPAHLAKKRPLLAERPLKPLTRPSPRKRGEERCEDQLCQRNCCALRCEPWLSLMLTSAGPGKFIASSSAPRTSFGSST